MSIPSRLYKYEAFTIQSLMNLKRQIVYFGSPLGFNDPYDCALKVEITHPSDEDVDRIRRYYLSEPETPETARTHLTLASIDQLRAPFHKGGELALQDAVSNFLANRGVTCFTEVNDDLLMWSHYGGKYKGFCLEFSTESEPFQKIWKVEYTKELPKLELLPLLVEHDFTFIQKLFCTKSSAWSYEREWRAIHNEAGTEFSYPSECLTGVYFGPDIDQQSLEVICLILQGQNEKVKFWQGSRSKNAFKVEFQPFSYVSFLEAKRRGLR